ncbi:MAG: phytanoyl-CoA dioxygenase family protein [Myxococcales bacterium]|nr:phytanoyl-CoA dioxygenase family protein [Myxococcales bacterium]HIK84140.1 phytanoyl-CoA dioxygenase family protein [Myxococcales bacterium]
MVSIRSPTLEGKKIHNPKQYLTPKYTTSGVAGLGHRQNCGSFPVDLRQREKRWRDLLVPELRHLNRNCAPSKIWAAINDDGCVIVDDFISPDLLEALRRELMPSVARHRRGTAGAEHPFWDNFHGVETKRITGLCEKSSAWVTLLCDPLYTKLGDHYLGANNYYLNTGQLICIGPNETPQPLHRDELNWPSAVGEDHETTITALFALTDFTEENGATVVALGSHRWPGHNPPTRPDQTDRATMKAGSALLYSGKIIHGGGPNSSKDEWRVGLHAGFVLGWLRSEENHQLTTSLETARKLPERVQSLLGFRSYSQKDGGRLGLIDYEDTAQLLK